MFEFRDYRQLGQDLLHHTQRVPLASKYCRNMDISQRRHARHSCGFYRRRLARTAANSIDARDREHDRDLSLPGFNNEDGFNHLKPDRRLLVPQIASRLIFIRLLSALAFLAAATAFAASANSEISVSIAAPGLYPDTDGFIPAHDRNSHFHVILTNISKKTQRIITDGNSSGDKTLSFEIIDKSPETATARRVAGEYAKNMAHWWVLQPEESVVIDVCFADPAKWEGFHAAHYGDSEIVTMRAIFEVPESEKNAYGNDQWAGRVSSKPGKFAFYNYIPDVK